jgi:hypothetical protein
MNSAADACIDRDATMEMIRGAGAVLREAPRNRGAAA